jgi:hypothetical protein
MALSVAPSLLRADHRESDAELNGAVVVAEGRMTKLERRARAQRRRQLRRLEAERRQAGAQDSSLAIIRQAIRWQETGRWTYLDKRFGY